MGFFDGKIRDIPNQNGGFNMFEQVLQGKSWENVGTEMEEVDDRAFWRPVDGLLRMI